MINIGTKNLVEISADSERIEWKQIGLEIIGEFLGFKQVNAKTGQVAYILTAEGRRYTYLLSDLSRKLPKVPLHAEIHIKYIDDKKTQNGTMKLFSVKHCPMSTDQSAVAETPTYSELPVEQLDSSIEELF